MKMSIEHTNVSKFLSYVLRHKPEAIGLALDEQGWADIDALIANANATDQGFTLTRSLLQIVVDSNDKKRFTISDDGKKIRAAQGHSVGIDLQLKPVEPPEFLYHGTATRFLDSILQEGLKPQQRQYVHLSQDVETATKVGQRYGKPVVLTIKARLMFEQGLNFYLSENGVWLTEKVPSSFLSQALVSSPSE
jgi:putative RNA 2'-phosphotransferase